MDGKMVFDESLFVSESVSQMFLEYDLNLLYVYSSDALFAVSTIEFPTADYPYVRMKGFNINEYRTVREANPQLALKLRKRLEKPMVEYFFKAESWIFIKDNIAKSK